MPRDKPTTDKEDMTNGEQNQKEPSLPLMYLGTRVGAGMLRTEQGIDKMWRRILFSPVLFPFLRWTKGHLAPKERKREVGREERGDPKLVQGEKRRRGKGKGGRKMPSHHSPSLRRQGGDPRWGHIFTLQTPFLPLSFFRQRRGDNTKNPPLLALRREILKDASAYVQWIEKWHFLFVLRYEKNK